MTTWKYGHKQLAIQLCRADGKDPFEPPYIYRAEGRNGPPQWKEYEDWAALMYDEFGARPKEDRSSCRPMSRIGEQILARQRQLGISQKELIRRTGLPATTVRNYLDGTSATLARLETIARALGCTVEIKPRRHVRPPERYCEATVTSYEGHIGERCSRRAQTGSRYCGIHQRWVQKRNRRKL